MDSLMQLERSWTPNDRVKHLKSVIASEGRGGGPRNRADILRTSRMTFSPPETDAQHDITEDLKRVMPSDKELSAICKKIGINVETARAFLEHYFGCIKDYGITRATLFQAKESARETTGLARTLVLSLAHTAFNPLSREAAHGPTAASNDTAA